MVASHQRRSRVTGLRKLLSILRAMESRIALEFRGLCTAQTLGRVELEPSRFQSTAEAQSTDGRSSAPWALVGPKAALVVGLFMAGSLHAQDFTYGAAGGTVRNLGLDSLRQAEGRLVWQAAVGGSGNAVANLGVSATVESRAVAMTAARVVPWAAVAGAAARAVPYVATASAVYEAAKAVRCYAQGTGLLCDAGAAPVSTSGQYVSPTYQSGSLGTTEHRCETQGYFANSFQFTSETTYWEGGPDSSTVFQRRVVRGTCQDSFGRGPAQFDYTAVYSCPGNAVIRNGVGQCGPVTTNGCPAVQDGLSGTIPAGPPGPDGLCPTGRYNASSPAAVGSRIEQYVDRSMTAALAAGATAAGQDMSPQAGPASLTGPATASAPPRVSTTTNPDGSTSTTSQARQANITYQGDSYTYNITNTSVTTNPGGTTTTETTEQPDVEVCGLPGKPACKIDETGTPAFADPGSVDAGWAAMEATKRAEVEAAVATPTFGFIGAPPVAACEPFEFNGKGSLDPCAVVENGRSVMAYLWALAGAWLCLGMIRKTVSGG